MACSQIRWKKRICQRGNSLAVLLPKKLLDALALKKGAWIQIFLQGQVIVLAPLPAGEEPPEDLPIARSLLREKDSPMQPGHDATRK